MVDYSKGLHAHFLSQGRVDAILLICGGEAAFLDSGYRANGLKCVEYMRKLGATKLKYYFGTHGHKNHIAGAGAIIEAMRPERVQINRVETKDAIIRHAKAGSERKAAQSAAYSVMKPGDIITLGSAKITCLGPLKVKNCTSGALAENQNSLVTRVDYAGRSLLLTGDTSAGALNSIYAMDKDCLRVEVLKNPHHHGEQPIALLKRIAPDIVVLCSNVKPSKTYQTRIRAAGASWYAVCKNGGGNVRLCATDTGWNTQ